MESRGVQVSVAGRLPGVVAYSAPDRKRERGQTPAALLLWRLGNETAPPAPVGELLFKCREVPRRKWPGRWGLRQGQQRAWRGAEASDAATPAGALARWSWRHAGAGSMLEAPGAAAGLGAEAGGRGWSRRYPVAVNHGPGMRAVWSPLSLFTTGPQQLESRPGRPWRAGPGWKLAGSSLLEVQSSPSSPGAKVSLPGQATAPGLGACSACSAWHAGTPATCARATAADLHSAHEKRGFGYVTG